MKHPQTILIVDDKPENLLTLRTSLASLPVEFVTVNSGNEALVASLHHDFAVAVLDVQMPDMDGYELAELLRSEPRTSNLPILFMSAYYRDNHHVFRGYEAGAVDFLVKPYQPAVLINKLKFYLQLDAQRRALLDKIELQESKGFLQSILTSMGDAVFVEANDHMAMVNDAGRELLGYGPDDILPGKLNELIVGRLGSIKAQGEHRRITLTSKQGEQIPVQAVLSVLKDRPGHVLVATDLREQLRMEQAKVLLEEQLNHMQRMESVGRLAGGVAHDLNNVFTIIQMSCGLLKHEAAIDQESREDVEHVLKAANQGEALVKQLLAIGRKQELDSQNIDLREVVSAAFDMIRRIIGKRITVVREQWPDEIVVTVDHDQMIQVMVNLALNARDAMDEGGTLTVTTGIDPDTPDWAFVEITDDGAGIAPDIIEQIFEPFFTTKGPDAGTGLGLSVVHGIVSQSGGKMQVKSTQGHGSSFRVSLALANQPATQTRKLAAERHSDVIQASVLVVEDNPTVLRLITRILKRSGYTVLDASTKEKALEIARGRSDLSMLCSDLNLTHCTGVDVATEVRAIHPDLPVLFMSGNAEQMLENTNLKGTIGFLQKPFSPNEFLARMQDIFSMDA